RSALVLLSLVEITSLPNDNPEIGEASGNVQAARSKSLSNGEGLGMVFLCLYQVPALGDRIAHSSETLGNSQTARSDFLCDGQGAEVVFFSFQIVDSVESNIPKVAQACCDT